MRIHETDVLVVGGGGAATASTIAAHDAGARTTLAVKGRFGRAGERGAGATSNPLADFWTIRTVGPKGGFFNPPESVLRDMVQTGLGMADPELCRIFTEEVTDAIKRLRSMGMRFQSKMLATMPANEESGGTNHIVAVQKAIIEGTGTTVLEQVAITDLLVDRGRVVGAVGLFEDGEPLVVRCGAVILAAGGVGQLFQYSFNPPGNTGDGYAMALRAGAELFNMEFMQQGLATVWPRQSIVMLYDMEEPYRLYNGLGKSFVQHYLPEGVSLLEVCQLKAAHWPVSCRDPSIHLDRAIHREALAGRATPQDGIFVDLAGTKRGFQHEMFVAHMQSVGIDMEADLIQVQVHHHTSNGGVRIDPLGQSKVTGLFAVGETAGWQGADRLGGTMLGGSQVFGWRAGARAAEIAKGAGEAPSMKVEIERLLTEPLARLEEQRDEGRSMKALLAGLQRKMWQTLLVEKDAGTLAEARAFLLDERERLAKVRMQAPMDRVLAFEQKNLLDVAEVIVEAADRRTESRGAHYRGDFPERDDVRWLTNIFARREGGALVLEERWINREAGWVDQPGDVRIKPWG